MTKGLILTNVRIRGKERVIARLNRIVANTKSEIPNGALELAKIAQKEAKRIIKDNTSGFGTLADSIKIQTIKSGDNNNQRVSYRVRVDSLTALTYADYVHNGFRPHWVKISDKPYLEGWIRKNLSNADAIIKRDRIYVGGPNSAPWIRNGGLKFMERAYAKALQVSQEELTKRMNKIMR